MTETARSRAGRSILRTVARVLGVVALVAFMALLVYGVFVKAPDTTIEEKLSNAESAPAPGFDLAILQRGQAGPMQGRLTEPPPTIG